MKKTPFKTSESHAKKPLDLVHTDITGRIDPATQTEEHRYAKEERHHEDFQAVHCRLRKVLPQ